MRHCFIMLTLLLLSACSAISTISGAEKVELVNEPPNPEKCEFLGEAVGSQGNWITGDYTSNENLIVGARNELRNKAFQMGGNIVYVQDMRSTSAYGAMGTTNTTAIGKIYRCKK